MGLSAGGVTALDRHWQTAGADTDAADSALAAAGDTRAYERLYRRHVGRVHGLARRMLGSTEADEATQDVFVRAWSKLGTFRGESSFGTWLYRLALNVMLNRRGAIALDRSRHDDGDDDLAAVPAGGGATDLALDFETAIRLLPRGARQVFVLHDVEGYRHDEIGTMLGIATGTSKARLHRARMLLREHLR